MNDIGILALFITALVFFICTPIIAYCLCNGNKSQYRILLNSNVIRTNNERISINVA